MIAGAEATVPDIRRKKDPENENSARHHFCLLGGEGDYDRPHIEGRSFLQQFLEDSGFQRFKAGSSPPTLDRPPVHWADWPASFADDVRGGFVLEHPDSPVNAMG